MNPLGSVAERSEMHTLLHLLAVLCSFPGSIAAITVTVISVVLLVFGVAAYLKIR